MTENAAFDAIEETRASLVASGVLTKTEGVDFVLTMRRDLARVERENSKLFARRRELAAYLEPKW